MSTPKSTAKKTVGFRLSDTTIRELTETANRHKVSQADVIAVLVHCYYAFGDIDEEKLSEWFDIARLS